MVLCICPPFIVVGDSCGVDHMGPIKQVIEFVVLRVCDCNGGVLCVLYKLPLHPFQGAPLDMILGSKDLVVPMLEVGILLIEDIQFIEKECVEMAEH